MNIRVEATEKQWVAGLTLVDYVTLDLDEDRERPWLEEARDRVELVGRVTGPADEAALARALELDVDFLALATVAEGFEARRLPLRLIMEQATAEAQDTPSLFGAAWARRIGQWGAEDEAALVELSRRERIFLSAPSVPLDSALIERVAPFAIAAPEGCEPSAIAQIRGS